MNRNVPDEFLGQYTRGVVAVGYKLEKIGYQATRNQIYSLYPVMNNYPSLAAYYFACGIVDGFKNSTK